MMKTPQLFKFFLLLCLSVGFVACSSDDSSGDDTNPPVAEGNFTKRVLVEDYTSTWCGNCPRVAYAIDSLQQLTDKMVAVGIHGPFGGQDDPFNFDYSVLQAEYDIGGLPAAKLNRTINWTYKEVENLDQAIALTGQNASIGLSINPSLAENNLKIDLKIKFGTDLTSNNLKMVVYVLESGLIADQTNYLTELYNDGGDDHILTDFEYNHVLRASLTDLLGDPIPVEQTIAGNIYTTSFDVPTTNLNVADANNISVVAFVVNSSGTVMNVRKAQVGATQTFQEL